jgi:hypothetical protein
MWWYLELINSNSWLILQKTTVCMGHGVRIILHCIQNHCTDMHMCLRARVRVMIFNATFNNISAISCRSVILVAETGEPGENHWPYASHLEFLTCSELNDYLVLMNKDHPNRRHICMSVQWFCMQCNIILTPWPIHTVVVSATNITDRHDIAEILLKVALNIITLTLAHYTWVPQMIRSLNEFISETIGMT